MTDQPERRRAHPARYMLWSGSSWMGGPVSIGAYDVATLRRVLVTDPAAFT